MRRCLVEPARLSGEVRCYVGARGALREGRLIAVLLAETPLPCCPPPDFSDRLSRWSSPPPLPPSSWASTFWTYGVESTPEVEAL